MFVEIAQCRRLDAQGILPEVDRIHVDLQDLLLRHLLFKLEGKVLLLDLALDLLDIALVGPVVKNIVFDDLLRDGGSTLLELTGLEHHDTGAQDSFQIDAVVLIKALVLDRDESIAEILWDHVDLLIAPVGVGRDQLRQLVALGVVDHCRESPRKHGCGIHVGSRAQDALESADPKTHADHHDRQGADQQDLQRGDKEHFPEFYGF